MQAVVPVAGEGTRMRPLTSDRPKGLVEVAGKPLLEHVFDVLESVVEECVVVVGYRGDQIRDQFGSQYDGLSLRYVTQSERRGLAHALLQAEPHIDGDFVSLNGDNVLRASLGPLVNRHQQTDAAVTALVERVPPERAGKGAVFALDTDGEIMDIVEKPTTPPSQLVPRGCQVFSPRIFEACRAVGRGATGEYELTDAIRQLIDDGMGIETVPLDGWCVNVNTPGDCERVEALLSAE